MKSDFTFFLDLPEKNFHQFLKFSLEKDKYFNHHLLQAGVIALTDVLKAIDEKFAKYSSEYIPLLHTILSENDVKKEVKLNVITLIGDICLLTKKEFVVYLKPTMEILFGACGLSLTVANDDYELEEYLQNLRFSLTETFSCIFFGMEDSGEKNTFSTYVPSIFEYFDSLVLNTSIILTIENYRGILAFYMDMFNSYGREIQSLVNKDVILKLLTSLKSNKADRYSKYAEECENVSKSFY